jgi:hypothetical protein
MKPLPCPHCGKPAHAWRVQLIDGAFWSCGCRVRSFMDAPCTRDFCGEGADEEEAVRNWNAAVLAERAHIDSLVGFVFPLDYAWAKRKGRRRHA